MSESKFKIGDVVQLASGGPAMTVSFVDDEGDIECAWFASDSAAECSDAVFSAEMLTRFSS